MGKNIIKKYLFYSVIIPGEPMIPAFFRIVFYAIASGIV